MGTEPIMNGMINLTECSIERNPVSLLGQQGIPK